MNQSGSFTRVVFPMKAPSKKYKQTVKYIARLIFYHFAYLQRISFVTVGTPLNCFFKMPKDIVQKIRGSKWSIAEFCAHFTYFH